MKKILPWVFFFAMSSLVSSSPSQEILVNGISWSPILTEPQMKVYAPKEKKDQEPKALMSFRFYSDPQHKTSASDLEKTFKEQIVKQCPGAHFVSLSQKEKEVTWHYTAKNCMGSDEVSEVARAAEIKKGIYFLNYLVKKSPMSEEEVAQWHAEINKISLPE